MIKEYRKEVEKIVSNETIRKKCTQEIIKNLLKRVQVNSTFLPPCQIEVFEVKKTKIFFLYVTFDEDRPDKEISVTEIPENANVASFMEEHSKGLPYWSRKITDRVIFPTAFTRKDVLKEQIESTRKEYNGGFEWMRVDERSSLYICQDDLREKTPKEFVKILMYGFYERFVKIVNKYNIDDSKRHVTVKDYLTEPEVLKSYCETHPKAVCLGGYGYFGCCPKKKKRKDFIKYDLEKKQYIRADGRIVSTDETYCGRKIPYRVWKGKKYLENRIWAIARLGIPDLIDGNMVIEAKGGSPSSQKIRTALGQLLFYREHEPSFDLGFIFPRIWLEAENLQNDFNIFEKYRITLIPI